VDSLAPSTNTNSAPGTGSPWENAVRERRGGSVNQPLPMKTGRSTNAPCQEALTANQVSWCGRAAIAIPVISSTSPKPSSGIFIFHAPSNHCSIQPVLAFQGSWSISCWGRVMLKIPAGDGPVKRKVRRALSPASKETLPCSQAAPLAWGCSPRALILLATLPLMGATASRQRISTGSGKTYHSPGRR